MPKGIKGFQIGNQASKNRASTKNLLPIIRERVLKALNKRITIDRMLEKIDDIELLKFGMSLMPKDLSISVSNTPVNYISNTPRPINTLDSQTSPRLIEDKVIDVSNALKNDNDNVSIVSNDIDIVSNDIDTDIDKDAIES